MFYVGVTLTYENGMVKMTNLSESAVFVQSRSMNENYQADPFAIIKLCQHNEAIIFNNLVSTEDTRLLNKETN